MIFTYKKIRKFVYYLVLIAVFGKHISGHQLTCLATQVPLIVKVHVTFRVNIYIITDGYQSQGGPLKLVSPH